MCHLCGESALSARWMAVWRWPARIVATAVWRRFFRVESAHRWPDERSAAPQIRLLLSSMESGKKPLTSSVHTGKEAAIGPRTARLRGHAHTHFEPATDHYAVGARSGAALRSPTYPCGASGCGEAMRTVLMRRYCGRHGASRDPMQGAREGKFETRTGPQLKITYACCA